MNASTSHFNAGTAHWSAVFSLFMGVTSLIAAEFIPVSLLTPIAQGLAISEGLAGHSVPAEGVFGVITSLLLAPLTKNIARRYILLPFSMLLVVANIIVAMAPNYPVMLMGRGILGVCVGGFWSMASAVTLQLVPTKDIPRALSIVYAGVSVATIISLPLASYLGHLLGWRNVFHMAALMGLAALIWQFVTLPSMTARGGNDFRSMFGLLKNNWVLTGIMATISSYGGEQRSVSDLRPLLETHSDSIGTTHSSLVMTRGVSNSAGNLVSRVMFGN